MTIQDPIRFDGDVQIMPALQSLTTLVVGGELPVGLTPCGRIVRAAQYDHLAAALVRHRPGLVISPKFMDGFDYLDVAYCLDQAWFSGIYRICANDDVAPDFLRGELRSVFPSLQVEVIRSGRGASQLPR